MPLTKSFRGKHSGDLPGSHFFSPVSGGTQCSAARIERIFDASRWIGIHLLKWVVSFFAASPSFCLFMSNSVELLDVT